MSIRIISRIGACAAVAFCMACSGSQQPPFSFTRGEDGFPMITPPETIVSEEARAEYLTIHFWDAYLGETYEMGVDSLCMNGISRKALEDNFALWAVLLEPSSEEVVTKAVAQWFKGITSWPVCAVHPGIFNEMTALAGKYMYDPQSPVHNEVSYAVVAQTLSQYPGIDSLQRKIYANQAHLCSLNKEGTKAGDFTFITPDGSEKTLYSVKAPLTLLVFSNPGCKMCEDIQRVMAGSPDLAEMLEDGQLAIVNIYPDEDVAAWRKVVKDYPKTWISGIDKDQSIRNEQIYNLWAIPSLYLLGSDKTVILKDAPLHVVLNKIAFMTSL